MKEKIQIILEKRKSKYQGLKVIIKKYDPTLYDKINKEFTDTENFSEKVYRVLNDLIDVPYCEYCKKEKVSKFINFETGYGRFCSAKCASNSDIVKEKTKNTCENKYGGQGGASKQIYSKIKKTLMKNHGVINSSQLGKSKITLMKKWFESLTEKRLGNCTPLFDFDTYSKHGRTYFDYEFECNKCKTTFTSYFTNGHIPSCPSCNPPNINKSKMEEELIIKIREFYKGKILRSNRSLLKDLELDIYLPDKKIAIEMNGLYWHSDCYKDKNYHINKTNRCQEHNVQLIHIFEDEWYEKKDIVITRIKHILGFSDRLYGRKCTVQEIDTKICNNFLNECHIQGKSNATIKIGLFHQNELVSVMTFSKPRYNKKYQWELIRFASSNSVVGGASKLLSYFIKNYNPENILTYADKRWSNGNLYKVLGFEYQYDTVPNYFYIKRDKRFSRIMFQKHKLENLLEKYDEDLTEYQNMKNNKFHKIWDCGNMVFLWNKKRALK